MKALRPLLYGILAVMSVLIYGHCQRRAGAREALQVQQDTRDDSVRAATRVAFDSVRRAGDSALAIRTRELAGARREVARLRARIAPRDSMSIIDTDTVYYRQLAVRDSTIAALDSLVVQQDRIVDLQTAMLRARDARIAELELQQAALVASRDVWRKQAQPGPLTKLARGLPFIAAGALLWEAAR